MRRQTRMLVVVGYLILSAVGIAYGQSLAEEAEAIGKLFMLATAILGVLFGASAAWISLGYRVTRTEEKMIEVCAKLDSHEESIRSLEGSISAELREIKRLIGGAQ